MEYIGKFISNFKEMYNGINAATLTGAIDVVIVQQEDGTFLSSPFHVRFGKLGVLRSREKVVDIEINGDPVDIHMKLGESGEAFFVSESPMAIEDGPVPAHWATSPIPTSHMEEKLNRCNNTNDPSNVTVEVGSESRGDTLMGNRDEGLLQSLNENQIVLGSESSLATVFKAETVSAGQVECSFKPIEPDNNQPVGEAGNLSESLPSLTEDERKKYKRKKRKRSQRKKQPHLVRELSKASVESSVDSNPNDNDEEPDDELLESSLPFEEEMKMGHRKSQSLSGIQVKDELLSVTIPVASDFIHAGSRYDAIISRSIGPEFHFFSDTEMEIQSPDGSRPSTPVHSDTEYEVGLQRSKASEMDSAERGPQQSWRWGQLPSPPVHLSSPKPASRPASRDASPEGMKDQSGAVARASSDAPRKDSNGRAAQTPEEEEAQRSMLSHMFQFMRHSKKMRKQAASGGGIYLDDLNVDSLDPELAALYITQSSFRQGLQQSNANNYASRVRDEDTESGKGLSLPQSPHSLSSNTAVRNSSGPRSVDSDFEDSHRDFRTLPDVAISLCGHFGGDGMEPPEELFLQSMVTYDDFVENPRLIENPDLLVRIAGKYYTWQAACPIIMSWALYQRLLPPSTMDIIANEYGPKRDLEKEKEKKKTQLAAQPAPASRKTSWFSWGRSKQAIAEDGITIHQEVPANPNNAPDSPKSSTGDVKLTPTIGSPSTGEQATTGTSSDNESNDSIRKDTSKKMPLERRSYYDNTDVYCKTLRLNSEQITRLNLREGPNEVVFSVTTAYQGTTRCKCHIYLWRYDDKVVISDVDGTITKSDVLGHILPIVGQDWAQSGVAQLFTKIKNNGYRILYLSARAIGQAHVTREYLRSVRQGDLSLPDGPLLLNPTSLLSAFHREVIEKKPEEFKISCLRDIQALFPNDSNPFYAGYGNRINDVWAYRAVDIPTSRIFTINPRGELKLELTQSFQSSYSKQSFIVDLVFPPFTHGAQSEVLENSEFSDFSYWKDPVPELPMEAASLISNTVSGTESNSTRKRRPSPGANN